MDITIADKGFKYKKVLVTGGCGFIGSHLVKRLIGHGALVTVIARESSSLWRLEDKLKEIEIRRLDIREKDDLEACLGIIKPEYVFHMSAYGVDYRSNDIKEAADTNIIGTINLIEALSAAGCKRIINSGSGMEYGCCTGRIKEDTFLSPLGIYGSTKAGATIIAHQIAAERGLSIVTLRPFGIFGEFEDRNRLFAYIILSALRGLAIRLTPCEQYRDYTYIENIADGYLLSALKEELNNEIMNIGSGSGHPLRYYIELVFKCLGADSIPLFGSIPYRENDLCPAEPDIFKIKKLLGWEPRVELEAGIEKTVRWFRNNMDKYYSS